QTTNQGIIHCIKRYVLSEKMLYALDQIGEGVDEPYKIDILTALMWCEDTWSKVTADTIQHCWYHSGLISKAAINF
ncbi:hypothetical protein PHYSODRAFT_403678, partial [Phytophthora sojae]